MSQYLELAQLLEKAAVALRQADAALAHLPSDSIDGLFSARVENALRYEGIDTIAVLCQKTFQDLLFVRNFGQTSLREVREVLKKRGLYLKGDENLKIPYLET